ncbi:hypothetical protein [Streptomyces sp. NBRC 110028]|uniref:hypothetical protein n=1 Tax=Streptomyces sp. NBRC 110028 TaxID=1621260 RepID=UPI0006E3DAD4|nr:hypothetical protein [Streptomyces sp. NBRC 110028]
MNLASADGMPTWGQGGSGKLKSSKSAWTTAGRDVGKLRGNIRTALTKLEEKQTGLGAGGKTGGGTKSGAAQRELYHSWSRYLKGVSGKCGTLQDRLEKAGEEHRKNDEATKHTFDRLDGVYKDTKPVGGESRGR